jgi:hypothetical protein
VAKKAEFFGECQCCGRRQKLPGGRLSLHGYTVQWNFFQGVCPGANFLPFEQDKKQAERQIAQVDKDIADLLAEIKSLQEKPLEGGKAWKHEYFSSNNKYLKSGYRWVQVEVKIETREHNDYKWNELKYLRSKKSSNYDSEPGWYWWDIYGDESREIKENGLTDKALIMLNKGYVDHLFKRIKQLNDYIAWQRKRCAEWKPRDLKPVKDD